MLTSIAPTYRKLLDRDPDTAGTDSKTSSKRLSLGAIFGASRSGTTWLGTLVSSHPEVAYRFEPFHRLAKTQPEIGKSLEMIRSPQLSSSQRSQLYHSLLPAYPAIEKPPFFSKNYQTPLSWGRAATWPISRRMALAGHLFKKFYTPNTASTNTPTLIFKQVEMVDIIAPLLQQVEVPVVYLMRHPCAVVWSRIQGQQKALMPQGRAQKLDNILRDCFPELAEQYAGKLQTTAQKEAMLWRIDVEAATSICEESPKGLPIFYEDLVENTLPVVNRVFRHFGLSLTQETVSFIEDSTDKTSKMGQKRGEIGIDPYFSVFRNSQVACNKWKKQMPAEDRARVIEIVRDSKPFKMAANRGFWSE
ncbi:sulfotransferase domain-containing protein [Oscillatoriales cyanobacterium LEGE 11467]|uniref:Sulfotransferase domain-containing protein n=1 Tax=Zarconia navalis LEGE 11467 TaxID=1828826 RepID=A0A928Z9U9_9CYAN|nr:sulfotransferase [Zarconia navalis]MBE9042053.1 sulfotransferase domain-containing protein [Zarconia navalis LEGE 11467]